MQIRYQKINMDNIDKKFNKVGKVLLVNDDGIDAPGFKILKSIAEEISDEIWVFAPKNDKSGAGRSITLRNDIKVKKRSNREFEVDGTPTDCVILGLNHFMKDNLPDLVLSGVNAGRNAADDVTYSGTVGAAWEATVLGVQGIALSQMYDKRFGMNFSASKSYGSSVLKKIIPKISKLNSVININFPPVDEVNVKGLKTVELDSHKLSDNIEYSENSENFRIGAMITRDHQVKGSDLYYLKKGYISITPLALNVTDYKVLKQLRENIS